MRGHADGTNVIAIRSKSDLGLSAEKTPTGSETIIHRIAPPKTSDAVTGAAAKTMSLTSWRVANEKPRLWSTTRRLR